MEEKHKGEKDKKNKGENEEDISNDVIKVGDNGQFYLSGIIHGLSKNSGYKLEDIPISNKGDNKKTNISASQENKNFELKINSGIDNSNNKYINDPEKTSKGINNNSQKKEKDSINNNNNENNKNSEEESLNQKNKRIYSNNDNDNHSSEYYPPQEENKNYEIFDINKDYYLVCKECKESNNYITDIQSVEYNPSIKDFKFKYKCSCEQNEKFFYELITEIPKCDEHYDEKLIFFCENCSKKLCLLCKSNNNHEGHEIKKLISEDYIADEIYHKIEEQKDNFKGFEIFEKIYNFYHTRMPSLTPIDDINENKSEKKRQNEGSKNNLTYAIENVEDNINKSEEKEQFSESKKEERNEVNNDINNNEKPNNINGNVPPNIDINNRENEQNSKNEKNLNPEIGFNIIKNNENNPIEENSNININQNNDIQNLNTNEDINNQINNPIENFNDNISNKGAESDSNNNIINNKDKKSNENIEIKENNQEIININSLNSNIEDIIPISDPLKAGNNQLNNGKDINVNIINNNINDSKPNNDNTNFNNNNINDSKLNNDYTNYNNNINNSKLNNDNTNFNNNINNSKLNNDNTNFNNNINNSKLNNDNANFNNNINNINNINKSSSKNQDINNKNIFSEPIEQNEEQNLNPQRDSNLEITDINKKSNEDLRKYKNTKTFEIVEEYKNKGKGRIVSLIKLESGYIASGSYDSSIRIWDITKKGKEALIQIKYSLGFILCLLEFKKNELIIGNSLNCIDIIDLNDERQDSIIARYNQHELWVTALVKCDEQHFASASNDSKIIIWKYDDSAKNIKKESILEGHVDCILTMILLNDNRLCTGSADNTIRVWDWKNASALFYFKAHDRWVKTLLQFNDKYLLSGSDDNSIKIWEDDKIEKDKLVGHNASVRTLCKIDDNYFASGSFDNKIYIWDFDKKKCVQTLEGHTSNVICIIKYDDKLISCSSDKTIKVWELE